MPESLVRLAHHLKKNLKKKNEKKFGNLKGISYLCNTYRNYIREVQEQCTERLPSMIVPVWWFARPLTPRVKGREGLCSFYFKNILRSRGAVVLVSLIR
jgi:hypothetical protein